MCSHIHSSAREKSDSEGDASKVETQKKTEAQCSCLLPQKPKEIYSASGKVCDLITAEHKIFNEGRESRNNHWHAVVVQVLATQWNPCQTKTAQETEKNVRKFTDTVAEAKSYSLANLLEFGKLCEEISWNHRATTPYQSEASGIAERAVRRIKEVTPAVLLQSGLDEKWWSDSMECYYYLLDVQDLLADRKSQYERRFGESFWDMLFSRGEFGKQMF